MGTDWHSKFDCPWVYVGSPPILYRIWGWEHIQFHEPPAYHERRAMLVDDLRLVPGPAFSPLSLNEREACRDSSGRSASTGQEPVINTFYQQLG